MSTFSQYWPILFRQYWRNIVLPIQYWRYNIGDTILAIQYWRYNIGDTILAMQYWRYNIDAILFRQYWQNNIAPILFSTQDIYSFLKLWQDTEIYNNIIIPGPRILVKRIIAQGWQ